MGIVIVGGEAVVSNVTVCNRHGKGWPHNSFAMSLSGCLQVSFIIDSIASLYVLLLDPLGNLSQLFESVQNGVGNEYQE